MPDDPSTALLALQQHPVLLAIYVFLVLLIAYVLLAMKYPFILPFFGKMRIQTAPTKQREERAIDLGPSARKTPDDVTRQVEQLLKSHVDQMKQFSETMLNKHTELERRVAYTEVLVKEALMQTALLGIYTAGVPDLYKLDSAIMYVKYHGNGHVREDIVIMIMKMTNGRHLWHQKLNEYQKLHGLIEDPYFKDALTWINQKLGSV